MTLGQLTYQYYQELFSIYMCPWEDLPIDTKNKWETLAELIGTSFIGSTK